jgi:type IV secretory pathway TrbD component
MTDTLMSASEVDGYEVPIHSSLGSPLFLGGAPRGIAILNGTVSAAIGLGLQQWLVGLCLWIVGHSLAVFAGRHDPDFAPIILRHMRQKGWFTC